MTTTRSPITEIKVSTVQTGRTKTASRTESDDALKSTLLVLEIDQRGIFFDEVEVPTATLPNVLESLLLPIPQVERHLAPVPVVERDEIQQQVKTLRAWLDNHQQVTVVLGVNEDPFHPFDRKFHASLSALEALTHANVWQVIIQTRSPLILLAMPVLLGLRNRLRIHFALEAFDDRTHENYTPGLPRPSERIKTVRSLARLNIPVDLQIAPIPGATRHQEQANELSELLSEEAVSGRVTTLRSLLTDERRSRRVGNVDKNAVIQRIDRQALDFLAMVHQKALKRIEAAPKAPRSIDSAVTENGVESSGEAAPSLGHGRRVQLSGTFAA